jgi:hypothetical protein
MATEKQEQDHFGKKTPGDVILVKALAILFVLGIYLIMFLKIMILK